MTENNIEEPYNNLAEAIHVYSSVKDKNHNELTTDVYKSLEKVLSTIWTHVNDIKSIEEIDSLFPQKDVVERKFFNFLLQKSIKAFPNVAQYSGNKYFIKENALKKIWGEATAKNVDGWLFLCDKWIPYDVKNHTISCLGFTFDELDSYFKIHGSTLFVVYDKKDDNPQSHPKIVLSLDKVKNNIVFCGPIEDYRKCEARGWIKKITGEGPIIPIDSKYALYQTETYMCQNNDTDKYSCPQFDESCVCTQSIEFDSFEEVVNRLFVSERIVSPV